MPKILDKKLIDKYKNRDRFSKEELYDFFRSFEPDLKAATFTWRIYDLKKRNLIKTIKRGWFVINKTPKYAPAISFAVLSIHKYIAQNFGQVDYCIWETLWLNEFLQHQSSKPMMIVEIEKGFTETLFYHLKDYFKHEVFLNPKQKEIDLYLGESSSPIVIKKLISRSPINKRSDQGKTRNTSVRVPALEKILVDIFADEKLFFFYQGIELNYIFENAMKQYTINYTRLFSYAERRDKAVELREYFKGNLAHVIIDDLQ